MEARRALTVIVGTVQSIIAVLIVIFGCVLYFDFFDVQTWLYAEAEFNHLHSLALLVFGCSSIISGLLLIGEWLESR